MGHQRSSVSRAHHPFLLLILFRLHRLFPNASAQQLAKFSKPSACPTHARLYMSIQLAITHQVSCRLDGGGLGEEPPLPVAAIGSNASLAVRCRGVGALEPNFSANQ